MLNTYENSVGCSAVDDRLCSYCLEKTVLSMNATMLKCFLMGRHRFCNISCVKEINVNGSLRVHNSDKNIC